MKIYPFPDTKPWKIVITLLLLALLALSRDVLYSFVFGSTFSMFLTAGVIVLLGVLFLAVNRRSLKELLKDRRILFAVVTCLIFLLPMVVKRDWQLMYLTVLMGVLGCVLISFFLPLRDMAKFYVVTFTVLGAYSILAAYLLRIPADMGLISYPMFINSVGHDFYIPLFSFVSVDFVSNRNFGIFREPGVYQFFLLLGLYLTFYQVDWKKERNMWICCAVLALTLLSTLATGGVVELCLLAMVVFLDKKYYQNKFLLGLAVTVVAGGAAAIVYSLVTQSFLFEILKDIFGKLFESGDSVTDRVGSIAMNMRLFLSSPLVGVKLRSVLHGIANNTSSSTILFAVLGIVGGAYHVAGWVALIWENNKRWLPQAAILVILALSCNTCNIMWNLWFWMMPTLALCQKTLPLIKRK